MKLNPHPRFKLFETWIAKQAKSAARVEGEFYRVAGPRHTSAKEIIEGVGAFRSGGRWNPPGLMNTVYLSAQPETAMYEANENHRSLGMPLWKVMPKVTVAVRVIADAILDLTEKAIALPEPMATLMAEDWNAIMDGFGEATAQAMGRAAFSAGLQGLIVPSKPDPTGTNMLIFPRNLTSTCELTVLNPKDLERLGK